MVENLVGSESEREDVGLRNDVVEVERPRDELERGRCRWGVDEEREEEEGRDEGRRDGERK